MLESEDGLIWRKRALFKTTEGAETAFLFEPDGSVLAVARLGGDRAHLLRSTLPYTKWDETELHRYIGGPLLARWGDRYVVGGRKATPDESRTALYWLVNGELRELAVLPSGGDNSYPGFVETTPTLGLVSWYSSHELDAGAKPMTAIYLAELQLSE